jgi:glutamate synthase (NADPH/NADH) small chain
METKETKPKKEKVPRQTMPEQDPKERIHNFEAVPFGYSEETAIIEAQRCIQCKKPGCVSGCPVDVKIPEFIKAIAEGRFIDAALKLKETNGLPAVCGRVCPQEDQCEKECILGKKGEPVAIGRWSVSRRTMSATAAKFPFLRPCNQTAKKLPLPAPVQRD